jgi:DNA polymerase/3'-5' exonuclease PolX
VTLVEYRDIRRKTMNCQDTKKVMKDMSNLVLLDGEVWFKAKAYEKAVEVLEGMSDYDFDRSTTARFRQLGIGEKVTSRIEKLRDEGVLQEYNLLMERYHQYMPLMSIPGVGAKKAMKLYEEHLCRDVDDVVEQIKTGLLKDIKVKRGLKEMGRL